jgi:hypothetical protein
LTSSTTYSKFRSRGDPRRPGSSLNQSLLPSLDLTSPLPDKSIRIPINPLPIWMDIPHHVVFPDVGYMFTEGIQPSVIRVGWVRKITKIEFCCVQDEARMLWKPVGC